MLDFLTDVNGWIGVGLGLMMFGLGYWRGFGNAAIKLIPAMVDATLKQMIEDGYIKTRKVLNAEGKWEEELLRHDEEV
jgi:hypothetical protein